MSVLVLKPAAPLLLTQAEWAARMLHPVQSKLHYEKALGPHIRDYLSWMINEKGRSPQSRDSYEWTLAALALMFPEHQPEDITKNDLRAARDTYPLKSRAKVLAHYRSFFKWLYREERVMRNVAELVDMPQPPAREIYEVYTDAEVARILKSGPDPLHGRAITVRDKVCLLLLIDAGLRRGELIALVTGDLDMAERVVIVRHGKGDKSRVVPYAEDDRLDRALRTFMSTPLAKLNRLPDSRNDHFLYAARVNQHGVTKSTPENQVAPSTFHEWHGRCLDRAGVKYRKPHMIRHTFGTTHIRQSGAERTRLLMGHASIQTTVDEYGHLDVRDSRAAVEQAAQARREREAG